jgi:hypothetical protein
MQFRRAFLFSLLLLATTACLDVLTGTKVRARVAVLLISLAESNVPLDGERMDVSISGPGIQPPIFGSFRFINDTARAELSVPLGPDRRVFVAVFDSLNNIIASGESTVEIGSGVAINVSVAIAPTDGTQPIIVTVGGTTITVTPGTLTLAPNATSTLAVTITNQQGAPIVGAVPSFASSNPSIASVSATGVVTARVQGITAITVTALGVAARIPVGVVIDNLRSP